MKSGQRRGGGNWRKKAKVRAKRLERRIKEKEQNPGPVTKRFVDPQTLKKGKRADI